MSIYILSELFCICILMSYEYTFSAYSVVVRNIFNIFDMSVATYNSTTSKKSISNQMWHWIEEYNQLGSKEISWDQKRSADRIIRGVSRSHQRWNSLTYIVIKKCHQHKDVNIAMNSLLSPSTTDLIFSSSNTSSIPWYFWIDTVLAEKPLQYSCQMLQHVDCTSLLTLWNAS